MRRIGFLAVALLICAVVCCACTGKKTELTPTMPIQTVRTLRFQVSNLLPEDVLMQTNRFADNVARMSKGKLQIQVVTGMPDHLTVKNGEADLAFLRNIQLSQADELFSMLAMPFLYDSPTHMSVALNDEQTMKILNQRLSSDGLVPLLAVYNGSSHLVTDKWELRRPSDFKDLIIAMRTDNASKFEVFEAMGARILPYTLSSVGSLLETEVEILPHDLSLPSDMVTIDTVEVELEQAHQLRSDPHTLYFIKSYHALAPLWVVGNQELLSQLTEQETALLQEGFAGLISELEHERNKKEEALLEQLHQKGFTIVEIDRAAIASLLYGSKGLGSDRYTPPPYFDPRIYKMIQSYS